MEETKEIKKTRTRKKSTNLSYAEILELDPLVFLSYLEQFKCDVSCNVESAEEMYEAGKKLGEVANSYSFLTSLYSYAGVKKRQLSRVGKNTEYQDMIDKEEAVERTMKAVDMQYRALSKAISVHIENNRELYYTDAYAGPKK